jgi:glutaredoxin-like protein NrdH
VTVDLYTKPNCPACTLTKRQLDKREINHNEHDIDTILDEAKARGITAAPIVVVDGQMWGGFRPDRIDALVA